MWTLLNRIGNIQPYPNPYPPAAHRTPHIIACQFVFGPPHPRIPHNVWHIPACLAPLLHSGMHVTIREYRVVDIWELPWSSSSEWVVYQCMDWKTGRRLVCNVISRSWAKRSTWGMVLAFFALLWRDFFSYFFYLIDYFL
jgi:hypothetical protein